MQTDYDFDLDYDALLDYDGLATDGDVLSGKGYIYVAPFQLLRIENEKREKLRREKTDLEKLESVLRETERRAALAAQSKLIAKAERAIELEALERAQLEEINRLLMVRAELMRRIQLAEQAIMAIVVMRKRRLRLAA